MPSGNFSPSLTERWRVGRGWSVRYAASDTSVDGSNPVSRTFHLKLSLP